MPRSLLSRLCAFVFLGLLLATPGEVLNQVLARHDLRAFRTTLFSYCVWLFLGFFAGKRLTALVKDKSRAMIIFYLAFGFLGLMVEWLLLGNAPTINPLQVITQPGMFTFWGTMMLGPCLILGPAGAPRLRRNFIRFFVSFSAIYLLVAATVPKEHGGIFFGFILFAAGSVSLNYFYVRYFRLLKTHAADGTLNSSFP